MNDSADFNELNGVLVVLYGYTTNISDIDFSDFR